MQKADLECGRYTACYDPPVLDPGIDPVAWSLPELLFVFIIVALILGLLWGIAQPGAKPKPTIKGAVNGVIDDLEKQADLWNRPEARSAFVSARGRINKEFDDRRIT